MVKAREMGQDEREVRNGVVDILCFLSSGHPTKEQMQDLKVRISDAVKVFQKDEATERVA